MGQLLKEEISLPEELLLYGHIFSVESRRPGRVFGGPVSKHVSFRENGVKTLLCTHIPYSSVDRWTSLTFTYSLPRFPVMDSLPWTLDLAIHRKR